MAQIIVVTKTFADIDRGDVTAVYEDGADVGKEVVSRDLFRVVTVPGPKADYKHLVAFSPTPVDGPAPAKYLGRGVNLDAIEAAEVAKKGRALVATDECSVATKAALLALTHVKVV